MLKTFSLHARSSSERRQALALVILGVIFLLGALLLEFNTNEYPLGVLLLGIGMLIATIFNPYRLTIAASLITALGAAVFLFFKHLIPGGQILPAYILAIGIGLLAIAFFTRRGYVGAGAVSPAVIVLLVGAVEALLIAGLTPTNFIQFMLSLWLPGIGLLALGVVYLLLPIKKALKS
jgi:hypothetical protein